MGYDVAILGGSKNSFPDELDDILDPGEAEAIILAEQLKADSLLLDEAEGRREALRRGLPVAGTIGVLEKAAERNLINLQEAFARLARTNFTLHRKCCARPYNAMLQTARNNGLERSVGHTKCQMNIIQGPLSR